MKLVLRAITLLNCKIVLVSVTDTLTKKKTDSQTGGKMKDVSFDSNRGAKNKMIEKKDRF